MKTNETGLRLIKLFEGLCLQPYRCPANIPTIGYGSCYGLDGKRLTMDHRMITPTEADYLLRREVRHAERQVARSISVPLTVNQFSALTSFTFNVGGGAFHASTLRRKINRSEIESAASEFKRWRYAGGRGLPGLVKRRRSECKLFLSA